MKNEHIAYHQLAMVYREMNDFQTALSYIEKEREVIEQDFSGDSLKILLMTMSKVIYD